MSTTSKAVTDLTCWKCGKSPSERHPGRIRIVQRHFDSAMDCWIHNSSESTTLPLIAPTGSRWACFHDDCGQPANPSEAWDGPNVEAWHEEPAE